MQKINIISCCAECSAFRLKDNRIPVCEKKRRRLDENSGESVNPALLSFPKWCPLKTVNPPGEMNTDYKKEVKKIMEIMGNSFNTEALHEASYYLNSIVKDAKSNIDGNKL